MHRGHLWSNGLDEKLGQPFSPAVTPPPPELANHISGGCLSSHGSSSLIIPTTIIIVFLLFNPKLNRLDDSCHIIPVQQLKEDVRVKSGVKMTDGMLLVLVRQRQLFGSLLSIKCGRRPHKFQGAISLVIKEGTEVNLFGLKNNLSCSVLSSLFEIRGRSGSFPPVVSCMGPK